MNKTDLILSVFSDDPEIVAAIARKKTKDLQVQIAVVETIKGDPGDRGEPGTDGRDGKDGKDGRDGESIAGPRGPRGEKGETVVGPQGPQGEVGPQGLDGKEALLDEEKFMKDLVEYIKKYKPLDISHIRNASSFMKDGIRYKIEELMHGGGSSSSTSTNVVTQYSLTATSSGADAVVDLSQLTHFGTLTNVVAAYRNQIPQTNGVTMTVTPTQITFLNADAGEVYSVTYVYS